MKLTIFLEYDPTDYGELSKPKWGTFKGRFKDGWFRRFWCPLFAVAFVKMSLHDYNRWIEAGNTEWRP